MSTGFLSSARCEYYILIKYKQISQQFEENFTLKYNYINHKLAKLKLFDINLKIKVLTEY